jgi:hypothetical protein
LLVTPWQQKAKHQAENASSAHYHVTSPIDAESSKDTSTLWITGQTLELQQKLLVAVGFGAVGHF